MRALRSVTYGTSAEADGPGRRDRGERPIPARRRADAPLARRRSISSSRAGSTSTTPWRRSALGEALELDPDQIRKGLAGLVGVPGRMERVECGQPFGVIVDYAHSPASLQKVLDLLGPVASGRAEA